MDKTEIKYISLLAPLFYLYGTIFLWAKNIHMFTFEQIVYSFLCVLTVAVILYSVIYFLLIILNNKIQYNKKLQICIALSIAALVGIISNFSFLKVIFIPYHHYVMYGIILFIFICIYFHQIQKIIIFFSFLFLFAVISFGYNTYNIYKLTQDTTKPLAKANNNELCIKFKDKPNIYLYWLESFQGTRTLNKMYQIDITSFINYLNNYNFSVCENMYSSSPATLNSMSDTYSLGYFNSNIAQVGNLDTSELVRSLIGGSIGNNVLKNLKYNDYKTNIIIDGYYYFHNKGQYLDFCTLDYFDKTDFKLLPFFYFTKLNKRIMKLVEYNPRTLYEQVEYEIDKMQKENKPYFLAWKGGATHTPPDGTYNYKDKDQWLKSNIYQEALQKSINNEIKEILSMILEKDKNALIILLGDHGSWVYRNIELNELAKENISLSDFVDDKFNVFCAVRLPEKYAKFSFDNGDIYINHSNIFMHIFSLLAENPEYLKLQQVPVSKYGRKIVVRNGIINEKAIEE